MMEALRALDLRRLVFAALFVPLLMFSFFSVHTMPRFSDQGMEIIICTATGFETVALGDDGDPAGDRGHSPCDWSMQIHAAALPSAAAAVEPLAFPRVRAVAFEQAILRSGRIESGRHARAPPVLL
ncbi:hypothetical protein [Hoeflea alexandrii]|uniref:hypothetical protein n=1 Tax=Hoeflea alexandrii TaxID=288436 RepID=UPI0022B02A39|nr:hypothetical protein [Hoeflea alexandrii]MCZ4288143.1 hypothetical protein [Hoeflea alexandrii]